MMARKLELKTIPLGGPDEKGELKYRKMLMDILKLPANPQAGINYEEMAGRLKLLEKLRTADGVVIFEDAEYEVVKSMFQGFKFTQVFAGIVELGDDIMNAETVEVK